MLPFSLGACVASFAIGFLVNILGDVRQIMAVSFVRQEYLGMHSVFTITTQAVMTLGFGLMIMLSNTSSM